MLAAPVIRRDGVVQDVDPHLGGPPVLTSYEAPEVRSESGGLVAAIIPPQKCEELGWNVVDHEIRRVGSLARGKTCRVEVELYCRGLAF